jgi:hypothetical protein
MNRSIAIVGAPTGLGIRTYANGEPRHLFQTSGESGVALLRIGRFTSKWRCQCGCRMLADLSFTKLVRIKGWFAATCACADGASTRT